MMFSNSDLKKLIIPLVIEQVLNVTIGMADTMMVSSCSEASVSGISLVDQINFLLVGMLGAMASGGAVVAAQFMGKGDKDMVGKASKQLFLAVVGVALLFMAAALLLNRQLLVLIYRQLEPDVMTAARTYFYITAVSYPFLGIYNSGAALFRAVGDSKVSMNVSFVANLLNVAGNALLIYGFHWDVAGAATSTLVSRIVCAVVICVLLGRSGDLVMDKGWKLDKGILGKIFYIGVPNGIENSIFQVGKLIVSSMIAGFGTAAITANAVVGSIGNFQNVPGNAMGMSMITVVGQCIGAGDEEQAKFYLKKLLKIAYFFMVVIGVFLILFSKPICSMYHLSTATAELTVKVLVYQCVCCMLVHPLSFALASGLRAAGDVKYTMVVAIASMWICRIVLAYILGVYLEMGLFGVWIAMTTDWLVRAVCFVARVWTGKWTVNKNRIIGTR